MVYKIHTRGENIDAEFGQPLNFTRFFKGQYGEALKVADECLRLLDIGKVVMEEDDKPVYVAVKDLNQTEKIEVPECHRCSVPLVDMEDLELMDSVSVGAIDDSVELCDVCADDMGVI